MLDFIFEAIAQVLLELFLGLFEPFVKVNRRSKRRSQL